MEKKNRYLYYSIFYSCLLLVAIGIYAYGWETPSCDPPGCNLPAPINAGLDPQTKAGNLTIGGNLTTGSFTMSAGAGLSKVLTTNASGVATWQTAGGGGVWGSITGTLSSQTDLQNALNGKAPLASPTFTGTVTAPTFSGALSGNATSASTASDVTCTNCLTNVEVASADTASDVTCTNCLTNVEVASADTASDLTCTDCIGTTEIADSYVLNTSDTMSGTLTVAGTVTAPTFSGALSGNATSATTASDVTCTNCLTATEVASANIAYGVSCTNCLTTTQVASAGYAATAGNGVPSGLVALFLSTSCPTGWTRLSYLCYNNVRSAVSLTSGNYVSQVVSSGPCTISWCQKN